MSTQNSLTGESVTLEVIAVEVEPSLLFDYRVANGLEKSIFLVNRPFIWTKAGLTLDPNLIYTEVTDGRLQLIKAFMDVPPGVRAEETEVPYLTEVSASESFSERVELTLPLEPFHPYNLLSRQDEVHVFEQVVVVVGWIPAGAAEVRRVQRPDGRELLSADFRDVRQGQQLLMASLPSKVPAYFSAGDR